MTRAHFDLTRGDHHSGELAAGRNFYPVSGEVSNEVGIRHDVRSGGDLFVIVDRLTEDGSVDVKVLVNPLVNLVWISALLMVAGGILASGTRQRRQPGREELSAGKVRERVHHG
jgi:cytochrome c biogenesis factor